MRPLLRLLAGNARCGPCRAERGRACRGASRVGRGVPVAAASPAPLASPGPAAALLEELATGPVSAAGAEITAEAGPGRLDLSCTRDKGRGAEGARFH